MSRHENGSIFDSAIQDLERHDQIMTTLDACRSKLDAMVKNHRETSMKFALESLPELIGEHQFRDLCLSMGIETAVQLPTGTEFADIVSHRVLRHHRDREQQRRREPGLL